MWVSHYFVFGIPSMLWPFTYFGIQAVNDMYLLLTFYLATLMGVLVVSVTGVMLLMGYASYENDPNVTQTQILIEAISYLFLTVGMYFFVDLAVADDTYQYLQLSRPKELRTYEGDELTPEGAEKEPNSMFFSTL